MTIAEAYGKLKDLNEAAAELNAAEAELARLDDMVEETEDWEVEGE